MPKFKIELELNSINERILLTNFDSSENSLGGFTFNENLTENENDQYNLNFSIAESTSEIPISKLISIGRPLWLYTYNPNKAIRMVISSFRVVIGSEQNILEVSAQDYASYVFSKNNAGLTLNTFEDEDFLDWLESQSNTDTTITNIANYVLQRGWLQKVSNSTTSGWTANVIGTNKIVNLEVSASNSYNALIDLANISNMNLYFDYENSQITFIDRESSTLEKNYTLKRDFNLQNFEVSYSGSNLYSIFYANGVEDEFGRQTLLSEETVYLDNFIYDFDYFLEKGIIDQNEYDEIINLFEDESDPSSLVNVNKKLDKATEDRFSHFGLISNSRGKIESIAEILAAPEQFNDYGQRYLDFESQFYRPSIGVEQVNRNENFKIFNVLWTDVRAGSNINFPIKFNYFGVSYTQETDSQKVTTPYGFDIQIFIDSASGRIPWPSASADPKLYVEITNETNIEFDIRRFRILSVDVQYDLSVLAESRFEYFYPFFDLLYEYDGMDAINKELARIQAIIDDFSELRTEDETELACLIANDPNDPECEDFFSDDPLINEQRILFLESRIDSYSEAIGEDLPNDAFIPGKYNLIKNTFERFLEDYNNTNTKPTMMDIYRDAIKEKQDFWYDLKENRQHIFIEGYYDNEYESNAESLKIQAEATFFDHKKPLEDFSLTYIDVSDIVGVDIENISVGDFVVLKEEKLKVITSEESKLKVSSISKILRDKANIRLTIFRYNMIGKIIERLAASVQ